MTDDTGLERKGAAVSSPKDQIIPNGKRSGDCTREDWIEIAGWLRRLQARARRYLAMADRGEITISRSERSRLRQITRAAGTNDEKFVDGLNDQIAALKPPVPRDPAQRRRKADELRTPRYRRGR